MATDEKAPAPAGVQVDTSRLLLSVSEVAQRLGIGKSMAYELIAQGKIPSRNIGKSKCIKVHVLALERWAAETFGVDDQRREG